MASHYKNSPNDLQLLSDAPAHHLFVLLAPVGKNSKSELPQVGRRLLPIGLIVGEKGRSFICCDILFYLSNAVAFIIKKNTVESCTLL